MSDPWQQSYMQQPLQLYALELCPIEYNNDSSHDDDDDETPNMDDHIDITINRKVFSELYALRCYTDIANYVMHKRSETSVHHYRGTRAQYDDDITYTCDYTNTPTGTADNSNSGRKAFLFDTSPSSPSSASPLPSSSFCIYLQAMGRPSPWLVWWPGRAPRPDVRPTRQGLGGGHRCWGRHWRGVSYPLRQEARH